MAGPFDVNINPEFDGTTQPVAEWFEKAELVCRLRNVKDLTTVVPLRLTGGALAVYQQLSDSEKKERCPVFRLCRGPVYSVRVVCGSVIEEGRGG